MSSHAGEASGAANDVDESLTIKPICLISQQGTGPESKLVIHDEGLAVLKSLGTTPVATVSVAGMYRTGKSFFMNQLMGRSGFVVGNTTTSCTRGIWIWVAPPGVWDAPAAKAGASLLVLDTEGLASFDQDETYDAKIFSLGILLASFFIYNSMGVIDESAIDRLFLVGELTKNISLSTVKAKNAEDAAPAEGEDAKDDEASDVTEADLAQFFPPFLWILRDFSLKLKDGDGDDISLTQYLETALEDRKGSGRRVDEGNRIRQSFRTLFNQRECFTLVRPVHEEEQLQKLSTLPQSDLRPEFLEGMQECREKILGRVAPKTVFGEVVTGTGLAMLATAYVQAINEGAVPDIRKSWDYVVEETLRLAYEAASVQFKEGLGSYCKASLAEGSTIPDRESYATKIAEEVVVSDKVFVDKGGQMAMPQMPGAWTVKLTEERVALGDRALTSVAAASARRCTTLAEQLLEEQLRQPVSEGAFDEADATVFEEAVRTALAAYDTGASGPAKAEVGAGLGKPLLDVFGTLHRRLTQQAEAKLAASESALRAEEEAKKGLEAVLESRNELVAQLEAAKAEQEAELTRTRESLATAESNLNETKEELHTTQRAKDVLESELGEAKRLHEEEVARGEAAKAAAEERLEEEKASGIERAAAVKDAHEAVVAARDEQIAQAKQAVEREQSLAQEATARHDQQVEGLQGEKDALQGKIDQGEEQREADRKAAASAAEQASAKAAELSASIAEQSAAMQVAAAEKATLETDLTKEKEGAAAENAAAEAAMAALTAQLEDSKASGLSASEASLAAEQAHAEQVRGLEDSVAEVKRQVEDAAREAERAEEMHQMQLQNTQGTLALASQEAEENAAAQAEELKGLQATNEELSEELKGSEASNKEVAEAITASAAEMVEKVTQIGEAQKEIQVLEAENSRVESELKSVLEKNIKERDNFETELQTEAIRREKLEELIDRMHHFQNEEIESSNALKLEEQTRKEQEAGRWHNVLKNRTAGGLAVAAESSSVMLESTTKSFSKWRMGKKATGGAAEAEEPTGGAEAAFGDAATAAMEARQARQVTMDAEVSAAEEAKPAPEPARE